MKVSVIIPTYNRAHQITAAIESATAQRHAPSEIIVVDDGSTDGTEALCAAFAPAVTYFRRANAGVSAARNFGASVASGDAVAFLDSDDTWSPDKLAVQVAALAASPDAGWSITGCDVIGLDGAVMPGKQGFPAVFGVFGAVGMSPEALFAQYLERAAVTVAGRTYAAYRGDAYVPLFLGNFALPSSAVVKRNLFLTVGGFDPELRLAEETEFFHRLSAASPVVVIAESLVGYRVGQAGSLISPANTRRLIANALASLDRAAKLRPATPVVEDHRRRGRIALLRKLAYAHLSSAEGTESRHAIVEGWKAGAPHDLWSIMVYAAGMVPAAGLHVLHRAKRRLRRA